MSQPTPPMSYRPEVPPNFDKAARLMDATRLCMGESALADSTSRICPIVYEMIGHIHGLDVWSDEDRGECLLRRRYLTPRGMLTIPEIVLDSDSTEEVREQRQFSLFDYALRHLAPMALEQFSNHIEATGPTRTKILRYHADILSKQSTVASATTKEWAVIAASAAFDSSTIACSGIERAVHDHYKYADEDKVPLNPVLDNLSSIASAMDSAMERLSEGRFNAYRPMSRAVLRTAPDANEAKKYVRTSLLGHLIQIAMMGR